MNFYNGLSIKKTKGLYIMKRPVTTRFTLLCAVMLILLLGLNPFLAAGQNGEETPVPPAAPEITGVTDGETYITPVTPAWEDAQGTTSEAALSKDGEDAVPFASGTEIAENGSYVLTVTATDIETGLTASAAVGFTIALDPPSGEDEQEQDEELDDEQDEQQDEEQDEQLTEEQDEQQDEQQNEQIDGQENEEQDEKQGELDEEQGEQQDKEPAPKDNIPVPGNPGVTDGKDAKSLIAGRIQGLKTTLTPTKRKLNTELLQLVDESFIPAGQNRETIKNQMMGNRQFIPAGQDLKGVKRTSEDLVYVYINLQKGVNPGIVDPYCHEIKNRDEKNGLAAAWVKASRLEDLAALPGVTRIHPVTPPVVNRVITEGYEEHKVNELWAKYGQGGAGVKIGVISDSVNNWPDAWVSEDLPSNLTVLSGGGGYDEGTAMLEIIHDLAPEAELYFHECGDNVLAFNEAIDNLIEAGCEVIVDDIGWVYEPFFEDGTIADHIKDILNHPDNDGLIYVSSAGNAGKDSYTYPEDIIRTGHYQGEYWHDDNYPQDVGWHDFSRGQSPHTDLYARVPNNGTLWAILQWDDRFGESANDYDLYLFDVADEANPELLLVSLDAQDGDGDPLEAFHYINTSGQTQDVAISVENYSNLAAAKTLELYIYTQNSGSNIHETNINGDDSIFGHPAVEGVIAAGAINVGTGTIAEYSSRGPYTNFAGTTIPKPDVCGMDGVSVSGAGPFPSLFNGTSAAAPHIAAIAALLKAHFPDASVEGPDGIKSMLFGAAVDFGDDGFDYTFGHGKADALKALEDHDDQPPELVGHKVINENASVKIMFNENIYYQGGDPADLTGKVHIFDSADNELEEMVVGVETEGRNLLVNLAEALVGSGYRITLEPDTLEDANGNFWDPVDITGITEDDIPPEWTGTMWAEYPYKLVVLEFDEEIFNNTGSAEDLKNAITCTVNSVNKTVSEARIEGNKLAIRFSTALGVGDVVVNVAGGTLKDANGLVLEDIVDTGTFDAASPVCTGYTVSADKSTVTFSFNENIFPYWDTMPLEEAVWLAADGENFAALEPEDQVSIDGADLIVQFNTPLSGEQNRIYISQGYLRDVDGNILSQTIVTSAIDVLPPVYEGATVSSNNSRISLIFHENIFRTGTADDLKNAVTFASNGVDFVPLNDSDGVSITAGTNKLVIDLVETVLAGAQNKISVAGGALKDLTGNIIETEIITGYIAEDTVPPQHVDTVVEEDYTRVRLIFNEEIINNTASDEALKAAIEKSTDGIEYTGLGENDEIDISGTELVIDFENRLSGDNNAVKINAGALRDDNGNPSEEMTITGIQGIGTSAGLSSLTLSSGNLSPVFSIGAFEYTASVSSSTSSIRVTPVSVDSRAEIKVNGLAVPSGQASNWISLNTGTNIINIVVTSEDSNNTNTYRITVTRLTGGGGGGGGGGYYPPPIQPLRPLPPAPILINTVTDDDKALEKSLQETGSALLDLAGDSDGVVTLSPGILTQLSAKSLPLLINNNGVKIHFYPTSLITQEIRNSLTRPGATVNIGARALDEQEKLRTIAQTPQGENTGIYSIGGEVFELTAGVAYAGPDGVPGNQKIEKFITPVSVTVNLAALRPNPEVSGQLCGVRLQKDDQGNIIPIPLGGVYNSQNYNFTFYTDRFSCYTVMLFKYKTALNMTIGSTAGYVNGNIKTLDAPPVIINNRTMVPLRFIGEALGASFKWDEATRTVTFRLGLKEVKLVVGKLAPGLDSPPVIVNDRTMVPVRYISEAFGAKVNWYPFNSMVTVFKE